MELLVGEMGWTKEDKGVEGELKALVDGMAAL